MRGDRLWHIQEEAVPTAGDITEVLTEEAEAAPAVVQGPRDIFRVLTTTITSTDGEDMYITTAGTPGRQDPPFPR